MASAKSTAPAAIAYAAPRNASVPVAHIFSTRVTGIPSRRRAVAAGIAELPTLTRSSADPYHAAPIRLFSIPASCNASRNASLSRCSVPQSHRSPNLEQPMPMMATLSLMPVAMCILDARSPERRRLPEIAVVVTQRIYFFDSIHHPQRRTDVEIRWIDVHHFHQHPCAVLKLHQANKQRRRGIKHQPVRCEGGDLRGLVSHRHGRQGGGRTTVHARRHPRKLHRPAFTALSTDEPDHLVTRAVQLGERRLGVRLRSHTPIEL